METANDNDNETAMEGRGVCHVSFNYYEAVFPPTRQISCLPRTALPQKYAEASSRR